jgi:MSHA pilin protein MshC
MRGFTMVELIMVIVIAGILAAVVGPRFFDRRVFDERLFYEETVAALRYAQKLAVASACRTQVTLTSGGYDVRRDASCGTGNSPAFSAAVQAPDGRSQYVSEDVPAGVNIVTNGFPVVFDSLGLTSAAAQATIGTFTITVAAGSGLVQ